MSNNQIPLTNIVNVSVSQTPIGVNVLNTSNVALFSNDTPTGSFPGSGIGFYVTPGQVATDWGSSSNTTKMANALFSQQPNILTGGGQLIIIKLLTNRPGVEAVQRITFSTVPTVGTYKLQYNSTPTGTLNFGDNATTVQTALRTATGDASLTVTGDTTIGFTVTFVGVDAPQPLLTVPEDSLQDANGEDVFLTVTTVTPGVAPGSDETLADAITRTQGLVNYFGVISTQTFETMGDDNFEAAATLVQALPMMYFEVSATSADITGDFADNTAAGNTHTRCLFYGDSSNSGINELLFKAAYVGRLLCVDFSASNTALTAQLKQLATISPDPSMTQTIYDNCLTAGVDCYPSFQGFAGISSSGANNYFDEVYNILAFASALQVAGFNYLAGTSTKIPQTEDGMNGLKGSYRGVCDQFVANGYLAPGQWNSSTTFGNQQNLLNNVSQFGYYIFSQPVALQTEAKRILRQAPLVQIAAKEAGAEHSTNVLVFINP